MRLEEKLQVHDCVYHPSGHNHSRAICSAKFEVGEVHALAGWGVCVRRPHASVFVAAHPGIVRLMDPKGQRWGEHTFIDPEREGDAPCPGGGKRNAIIHFCAYQAQVSKLVIGAARHMYPPRSQEAVAVAVPTFVFPVVLYMVFVHLGLLVARLGPVIAEEIGCIVQAFAHVLWIRDWPRTGGREHRGDRRRPKFPRVAVWQRTTLIVVILLLPCCQRRVPGPNGLFY